MKEKYCSNCGGELKDDSNFCTKCGRQINIYKNPWIAAILNFIIPGVGFIYLGRTEFMLIGIAILIDMLASVFYSNMDEWFNIGYIIFGIIISFILAVSGYIAAEQINKQGGQ